MNVSWFDMKLYHAVCLLFLVKTCENPWNSSFSIHHLPISKSAGQILAKAKPMVVNPNNLLSSTGHISFPLDVHAAGPLLNPRTVVSHKVVPPCPTTNMVDPIQETVARYNNRSYTKSSPQNISHNKGHGHVHRNSRKLPRRRCHGWQSPNITRRAPG